MIQIDNVGTVGIVTDRPPHELPLNAWSGGNNVRFRDDAVERSEGETSVYSALTIDPYWMMPYADGVNIAWFYANATKIHRIIGATDLDVTRASGDYSGGTYPRWNGGVLGGVPIMNNDALADVPQSWDSATSKFVDLTNWPSTWKAKVIRPFKQFLVAMDMSESGTRYPTRVRWSSPADPGTVPVSWVPAATNLAGSVPLSEETDFLVDALTLRDVLMVYKGSSTYIMQFSGGNAVFTFRKAFPDFGLLAQRCVKNFYGKHFLVSQGDAIIHDGQTPQSVMRSKNRRSLFALIDADNYENSFVVNYPERTEMWVCFPSTGSTYCDMAYVWNWTSNTWAFRELPDVAHIGLGIIEVSSGAVINAYTATMDSYNDPFDQRTYNPSVFRLLMGKPAGSGSRAFYQADVGYQFDTSDYASYVERSGLAFVSGVNGTPTVDTQSLKFCQRVYPKIDADPGVTVTVRVGYQTVIDGPVTWQTTAEFDPSSDKWVDCRCLGVATAVQFRSSSGGRWRLSSYGLDVKSVGRN